MSVVLLCLHGWGGTKESFAELRAALKGTEGLTILMPDLPGFGENPEPNRAWTVDDYADWVERWTMDEATRMNLNAESFFVLGHSHGGRIAITLASREAKNVEKLPQIDRLILCASAGIRRTRHWKRIFGLLLAKTGKFFLSIPGFSKLQPLAKKFLYRLVRVHDYEQASPVMRETLILVTKQDLRPLLPSIKNPTDIFWGEEDQMTPLRDGKLIHELISGSTFTVFPGIRHRVHRDKANEIAARIRELMVAQPS